MRIYLAKGTHKVTVNFNAGVVSMTSWDSSKRVVDDGFITGTRASYVGDQDSVLFRRLVNLLRSNNYKFIED